MGKGEEKVMERWGRIEEMKKERERWGEGKRRRRVEERKKMEGREGDRWEGGGVERGEVAEGSRRRRRRGGRRRREKKVGAREEEGRGKV